PAPLTVTADNQRLVFGSALPTFTVHYSGFVNGDTAASLSTQPRLSTSATSASSVGVYPISASGAQSTDYAVTAVDGSLSIMPDTTSTTLSNSGSMLTAMVTPGGSSPDTLTGSVVISEQGTPLATVPVSGGMATIATSALPLGEHTLTARYVGDANHAASSSAVLTVNFGTADERFVTQ